MRLITRVLLLVSILGCSPTVEQGPRQTLWTFHRSGYAPGSTLETAIGHIVARVGQEFFDEHVFYVSGFGDKDLYLTRWMIKFDSIRGARQIFFVVLTPEGELKAPIELPDCVGQPSNCQATIDREQAEMIAASALEFKEYDVVDFDFRYAQSGEDCFVWLVSLRPPKLSRERGRSVTIDASSGQVLNTSEFRAYKPPPN